MPSCAALYCTSTSGRRANESGITFHMFPRSRPQLLDVWLNNLNRNEFHPIKSSVLCSTHFEEVCFDRTGQTVRLREGAVPTRFKFANRSKKSLLSHPSPFAESEFNNPVVKVKLLKDPDMVTSLTPAVKGCCISINVADKSRDTVVVPLKSVNPYCQTMESVTTATATVYNVIVDEHPYCVLAGLKGKHSRAKTTSNATRICCIQTTNKLKACRNKLRSCQREIRRLRNRVKSLTDHSKTLEKWIRRRRDQLTSRRSGDQLEKLLSKKAI